MDRIPRKNSKNVVYFQHGIMDSSHPWVSQGENSLALRAYDAQFDVFLGNFRGSGILKHKVYLIIQFLIINRIKILVVNIGIIHLMKLHFMMLKHL